MPNYTVTSVDDYISKAPDVSKPHLMEIRAAVESALPTFEKEIGYGKPYYKYHGWVVGFDVYKNHIGFEVWDGFSDEKRTLLENSGYKTGSVTFQIRYDQHVPTTIIRSLVEAQAKLNETKSANKNR